MRIDNPICPLRLNLLNKMEGILCLFVVIHAYLYLLRGGKQFCDIALFDQIAFF